MGAEVHYFSDGFWTVSHEEKRANHVVHIGKVSALFPRSVNRDGFVAERHADKFRNDVVRVSWPVGIERADDRERESVRLIVRISETVSRNF